MHALLYFKAQLINGPIHIQPAAAIDLHPSMQEDPCLAISGRPPVRKHLLSLIYISERANCACMDMRLYILVLHYIVLNALLKCRYYKNEHQ